MSRSTLETSCAPSPPPPAAIAPPSRLPPSKPGAAAAAFAAWGKLAWPVLALLALLLFNWLFTPGFLSLGLRDGRIQGSVVDIMNRAAPMTLVALGMTLVIATGGVDLSVGAIMAISGAVAALLAERTHLPLPVILLAAMGASLLCGAWNGVLVALLKIQPIIATLLLMVAGRGIAQMMCDDQIVSGWTDRPAFDFIGRGYFLMLPFAITIVVLTLAITTALTRLTALGLFIESVGDNETAARFAGINDRFVKFAVYAFSGACAGVGGLIYTTNLHAADSVNSGLYLELDAILAAVIGGTALVGGRFYLLGTIVGALIIQTLTTTILTRGVPVEYTLVVKAVVVLGVCLLQAPRVQRAIGDAWQRVRGGRTA